MTYILIYEMYGVSVTESNILDEGYDNCPPQVNKKLWNWFYKLLVLLSTYSRSQGKHVKSNDISSKESLNDSNKSLRNKFLNELAYICDYSSSKDTMAAIAIQNKFQLIYWVAANISQGSKVKFFLFDILQLLGQVYDASEEKISTLKQ